MSNLIGAGVITCNRENLFRKCIASVKGIDNLIVVNDGKEYSPESYPVYVTKIIQHKRNMGVGKSKNEALKFLLDKGCRHIFLIEDDVRVTNPEVFQNYINCSEGSGIPHLNFAYHGPGNKDEHGNPSELARKNFNGVEVSFHKHLAGAFSYYNSEVLNKAGLIDERFKNAFDHLDHTLQIIKYNMHPPFGWFADLSDSYKYIEDLDPDLKKSIIRQKKLAFRIRLKLYSFLFKSKNGFTVEDFPKGTYEELITYLKNFTNYKG